MPNLMRHSGATNILALLCSLFLATLAEHALAVSCSAIFTNGVQSHNAGGLVELGYQVDINGGSDELSTVTLNLQSPPGQGTCNGSTCTASGSPAAPSSPTFVFGDGGDGAVNVTGGGNNNLGAGDYTSVSVSQFRRLTFNDASSTYLMESLSTGYQSEVRFRAGDYWINGNMNIGQETELDRQGGGTVRIFVNGNVQLGYQSFTSDFAPGELLIYATGNITLGQQVEVSGFFYAGGNMQVGYQAEVDGAVSGGSAQLAQEVEINYDGGALVVPDFAPFCDAEDEEPARLVSHWTMDEFLWNGTPGEVLDSSGNNNHATATGAVTNGNTPAIVGNPGTCRFGEFDGVNDYLAAPGLSSTLNATASLAFWINTTMTGNNIAWQAPGVTGVEQNGGANDIFWGWLDASGRIGVAVGNNNNTKSSSSINNGVWRHVVLTRDHQAGTYQVYIDGALDASGAIATGIIGTGYSSIGRVENTSPTAPVYLNSLLDEVHVFEGVLTAAEISALMAKTRPCLLVDHYTISHSGNGVTCEAELITITARDSDGNAITPPAGTELVLSTNPGTGVWVGGDLYTFTGSESQISRYLQQTTPATLNIDVTDGSTNEIGSADPDISFADTGLRFYGSNLLVPVPAQLAGVTDTAPVLRAVRTNTDTGACEARVSGSQTVRLGYACLDPLTCSGGQTFTVNGTGIASNNSGTVTNFADVALNFDANGAANIPLNFTDVGRVQLHAQLLLDAEDEDPAVTLVGGSNDFVVRPYRFVVTIAESSAGVISNGSNGFAAAGEAFRVVVQSQNADGGLTPNYGNEQSPQGVILRSDTLVYPIGGVTGTLTNGANFLSSGTAGEFENESVTWDEVGTLNVNAHVAGGSYLGAGDVVESPNLAVGRFYPHHFHLASSTIEDTCTGFTYMSHPAMTVQYQLVARNLTNGITTNYRSPGYAETATVSYVAENADDGTDLGSRVNIANPPLLWSNGTWQVDITEAMFERRPHQTLPAPARELDGPLNSVQMGLRTTDVYNRPLQDPDMNAETVGDCVTSNSCDAIMIGSPRVIRFGRLRLDDAFGPESVALPVKFTTQFWNGSFFAQATTDSCTQIPRAAINYPAGSLVNDANRTVALNGGSTQGIYADLQPDAVRFNEGSARHYFSAPGIGIGTFAVDIDLNELPWLRFDWDQNSDFNNDLLLRANFGFGQYRGHDRIIYWREDFQ